MIDRAGVLGVVLAGGSSRRMGRDKSLLPLHGLPLIAHAVRLMQGVFREVIVVSDYSERYKFLGIESIPDQYKGAGPLAGIHAALMHARGEAVFISSCDTPLVPQQLIDHILDYDSQLHTRIPRHLGILQPLFGLYDRSLVSVFEKQLSNGVFGVQKALEEAEYLSLEITPELSFYDADMFCNVNDPGDYARVKSRFRKSTQPSF